MTKNYEAAMEKSSRAIRAFAKVQADYRSRQIGDADYLNGRKAYESAMAEYDGAFAAESQHAEEKAANEN